MKRLISLTIAFCLSIAGISVPAAQAEDYSIPCSGGGSVPVTGTILGSATGDCAGEVVIPAEITEMNSSFRGKVGVTSITFEEGSALRTIYNYAIDGTSITSLSFPNGLESVGNWAVANNSLLTSVSFPSSLKLIDSFALSYNQALVSISIPSTLERIAFYAFFESKIESVTVEPRTEPLDMQAEAFAFMQLKTLTFQSQDEISTAPLSPSKRDYEFQFWSESEGGSAANFPIVANGSSEITLFANYRLKLVQVFNCSVSGTFTTIDNILTSNSSCTGEAQIPSFVTSIKDYGFGYSPVSKVIIPATLKRIEQYAFIGSAVETVEFEEGSTLEFVGYGSFNGTKNLTDFSLPASVTEVQTTAFENSGLEHFTLEGPRLGWLDGNWAPNAQLATFTYSNVTGSVDSPGTQHSRIGNTFEGWSTTDGGDAITFPYDIGDLTEITLYAKWAPSTFAVTYDSQGGTEVDPGQVVGGEITSPPTPPTREGYTFDGWKEVHWYPVAQFPYNVTANGALTLYAQWTMNEVVQEPFYQVNFDLQAGSWTDFMNTGGIPLAVFRSTQPVFGTGPFTAVREGYTFGGWSTSANGEPISFPYAPGVSENITLYALWISDVILREVSFISNGGSEVESASFADGGEIESAPEEPTRDGYTFEGWSDVEDGEAVSFPYTPSVTEDIVLFAKWAANVYEVIFDSNGGSAVTAGSFVTEGEIASAPTAPTRTGFIFAGWSDTDGGTAVSFPHSPGVFEDITLYAKWTAVYKITYFSTGGSSVSAGTFVNGGKLAAAPAAPKRTGFTFGGWSATNGGAVIKFPYTPGVSRNISLYAKWVSTKVKAVATVKPTVTGLAKAKSILKANKGTWKGSPTPAVAYQWYLCTKAVASPQAAIPSTCKVISGKTSSSLTVTTVYKGKFLAVRVTGTSAGSTPTVWLSKSTGAVS